MLSINHLSFSYHKNQPPVLKDFSLNIQQGTICGLLGKNGAGKSTLLYLISGLLKPNDGTVTYNSFNPWKRDVEFLQDIFIVPEEFELPNVSLKEFLLTTTPFYPNFSMSDLERHLATFELSSDVHLGQLSMGQKKRAFVSFALACNTSLLILDEPTNGLDIPGKRLFRKAILNGMTDNKTVIISTHQVYDVEKILDHVVITDTTGVLLNSSVFDITSNLRFRFTPERNDAIGALISLDAPGGFNIVERREPDQPETEINLETLFELATNNSHLISDLLPHSTQFDNDK